ncbi:ABC transporter permease [Actinobacteria bacterium YIM 96077]|uniref:ABC transporter permease n=1 Tax=Phytoactinopolyspora halophila TaxID=1981511 RepID=A0A329QRM6_9ACTN|nr:ABC transporter permease [Phytoactinopolyspora halophila]AYY14320.1 ABC transporter permease [Actinobacteria bacterium YIM 96077]RAW14863.1 ABC transporter permease [Phytoactinopolyspora halophila]
MSDTRRGRIWTRLGRQPTFYVAAVILSVLALMALAPGLFTSTDPMDCDLAFSRVGPGDGAYFGYNLQGCDLYSRTIHGARASLVVGVFATTLVVLIGGGLGTVAGYFGSWVDAVVSRITDVFFGIPLLLGALVVLVAFPSDVTTPAWQTTGKVVLAITVLGWTTVARIMRADVIEAKEADYVDAARSLGAGHWAILRRHVLPNAIAPVLAWATVAVGTFIAVEATLSFIGIGLQPPVVSWGVEIGEAQAYVRQSPHMIVFPSAFLSVTVLAFVLLGDAVRRALHPPRPKGR